MPIVENRQVPPLHSPGKFYINGEWTNPSHNRQIEVISPATEEVYMRVAAADEQDMNQAVAAARAAFDRGPWPRLSHMERAGYLRAIAREIGQRGEDSAKIWVSESGVTYDVA